MIIRVYDGEVLLSQTDHPRAYIEVRQPEGLLVVNATEREEFCMYGMRVRIEVEDLEG